MLPSGHKKLVLGDASFQHCLPNGTVEMVGKGFWKPGAALAGALRNLGLLFPSCTCYCNAPGSAPDSTAVAF